MQGNNLVQLLHKVHLQGTAYTAVLQSHQAVIIHAYHTTLLDEGGVNVDLTYIIYYNREPDTLAVAENPVQKGCLSAA